MLNLLPDQTIHIPDTKSVVTFHRITRAVSSGTVIMVIIILVSIRVYQLDYHPVSRSAGNHFFAVDDPVHSSVDERFLCMKPAAVIPSLCSLVLVLSVGFVVLYTIIYVHVMLKPRFRYV